MASVSGFKRIARDIAALAELQLQLLAIDGKVAATRGFIAVAAAAVAAVIALSSFTVFLIAAGVAIYEFASLPLSGGLLISGIVGLIVAVLLTLMAWRAFKQAFGAMEETRSELANNIRWAKLMLSSDDDEPLDGYESDPECRASEPFVRASRSPNRVF